MDELQGGAVQGDLLRDAVERLGAVAVALEAAVGLLMERGNGLAASVSAAEAACASVSTQVEASVGRIVATVESAREAELERKLAEAERVIAELRATGSAGIAAGRKTAVAVTVMAKGLGEGVSELASVDMALQSLSVEQRIAVKAEMLRAGLLR